MPTQPLEPIPEMTRAIVLRSFPKGCFAIDLRKAFEAIYQDIDFASVFPKHKRTSPTPWQLTIITMLQAEEVLSDRQTAEMLRARLDWKYALSLPLEHTGFDAHILTDFRQHLLDHHAQELILEPLARICTEHRWLIKGGQKYVDTAMILAIIERVNKLENMTGILQTTFNELADADPNWLETVVTDDWFDRYVDRFELRRFPQGKEAQEVLLRRMGADSKMLLNAATSASTPEVVKNHSCIQNLKKVYEQYFNEVGNKVILRDDT